MNCGKCGGPMKLVPAGISKRTGKPYNAFWACQDKACGFIYNPPQAAGNPRPAVNAKDESVKLAQERKAKMIEQAQARREVSIREFNALNSAISLVSHHPLYRDIPDEKTLLETVIRLQGAFYFGNVKGQRPDEEIIEEF